MSVLRNEDYTSFRASVQQKRFVLDDGEDKAWTLYDAGPRTVRCPIICLPPASGRAEVFFRQILALSAAGYRIIAVEYPVYWKLKEFNEGFRKLLDHLNLDKVHILGASLGGFLAQKFAEYTHMSPRVESLMLCNAFVDTAIFQQTGSASTFWMMPALVLKKMVMGGFDKGLVDPSMASSIDFMVESLDSLSQKELASRLTMNCANAYVAPQKLKTVPITLIDVYDECALSQRVREEMYKCYPNAKRAHLKSGGNFPYLSRADEVNLYIQIHMKQFLGSRLSAKEESDEDLEKPVTEPSDRPTTSNYEP